MAKHQFVYGYQSIIFEKLGILDAIKVEYAVFWDTKSI